MGNPSGSMGNAKRARKVSSLVFNNESASANVNFPI